MHPLPIGKTDDAFDSGRVFTIPPSAHHARCPLPVGFAAMGDARDSDAAPCVVDYIKDSIVPNRDAPPAL
jgi:hypothetical protein